MGHHHHDHHGPEEHTVPSDAAELAHGAHLYEETDHVVHPPVTAGTQTVPRPAPGTGGPSDPAYWDEEIADYRRRYRAAEDEGMARQLDADATAREAAPYADGPSTPGRSEVADILQTGGAGRRVGSAGRVFDPMEVNTSATEINYPAMDGARDGWIRRSQLVEGDTISRYGSTRGRFFARGEASLGERALPRSFGRDGTPLDAPEEFREYSVVGDPIAADRSVAAPAFGEDGGARQVRLGMSAEQLHASGRLALDWEQTPAAPDDAADIDAAVREYEATHGAGSSSGMEGEPLVGPELPPAIAAAPHEVGWGGQLMGGLGALAGLWQAGTGLNEWLDGDMDMGATDLGAGGVGAATGIAATGFAGPEAAAFAALPPVALGSMVVGALAAGHHYNAEHGTFGEVGETSVDFAVANGLDAGHGIHDWIAGDDPGMAREAAADVAGVVGGGVVGAGAGIVGLGGDLAYGAPAMAMGLFDAATHYGDEYITESDPYGEPTENPDGTTHHVSAHELVTDNATGAYDAIHDGIAGLAGPDHQDDALGMAAGGVGTVAGVLGGGLVGLGAGVIGAGGAIAGTVGRAGSAVADGASSLWSWMTD